MMKMSTIATGINQQTKWIESNSTELRQQQRTVVKPKVLQADIHIDFDIRRLVVHIFTFERMLADMTKQ